MDRRTFLKTTGSAIGVVGIAGCEMAPGANEGGQQQLSPTPSPTPTTSPTPTETPTANGSGEKTIQMITKGGDYYFDPIGLFVEPDETVTWTIKSGSHSSTAYKKGNDPASVTRIPDGAKAWDSGILSGQGTTFEYTFTTKGTYDYFCLPHKTLGMVGRIVVGKPGGPADGSMPPDGDVPTSQMIVDQKTVSYAEFTG